VEIARRRSRLKRGGSRQRVSLDDAQALTLADPPDDLLVLDEALGALEQQHPGKAQLVKLRYFAGLTIEQAAEAHCGRHRRRIIVSSPPPPPQLSTPPDILTLPIRRG
jgi:DNA-directed RNA polymerase specialized sigma24 family protein